MRDFICILRFWVCSVTPVCMGFGAGVAGYDKGDKAGAGEDLFVGTQVPRIQIEISRPGIAALEGTRWRSGQERPTAQATVREGSAIYTNVAVHLKGSAGSFRPIYQNPCLTLNFNKFAAGQSFHGLHKISLNNSIQDRSFLAEKVCRELFDAAGVPVPRAGHAKVELNGRNLGLYVLTEGFNKQFLRRYFQNTRGNLYDGGFLQDITAPLVVNSGDDPDDHSGLSRLVSAVSEPDPARRWARLDQALDVDRFLSFLAMDVLLCDWDGYAMNRNNWRIFHDLGSNRMVFFPHGLDQMFGVARATPELPILPPMQGIVARAVVESAQGRTRYLERLSQLYTNVFRVDALLRRVDELAAVIRPVVAESNQQAARRHDQEVQWLKQRIRQRDESLRRQLTAWANLSRVHTNGAVRLAGWRPRIQTGAPELRELPGEESDTLLYIRAAGGNTIASWRTRAVLEQGEYRFEGMVRTQDVKTRPGETGGGAGLRVSGRAIPQGLSGNNGWRKFVYRFQMPEGLAETEFVCELRASEGEAWFDAASLAIVRLR